MALYPVPLTKRQPEDNLAPATTLLVLLFAGDLAFILLHLVDVETGWMRGMRMSLEVDGGMPETYQYVKEFWLAACMAITLWRTRVALYGAWSAVFAFLLLDDAAQIHERTGAWLARSFELPAWFGLRPDDTGELMVAATVGLVMIALVGLTSWRRGEQSERVSRDVLALICMLGVLGVFVDMLHVLATLQHSLFAQILLVVEDGGEMVVMSALTAYTFHVTSHRGRTRFDLWATLKAVGQTEIIEFPRLKRAS